MSSQVFPSLAGLGFNVKRSPIWNNIKLTSASGKEYPIAFWSYPRYQWSLTFNFLRSNASLHEFQDLVGFFNNRTGGFDSFLYTDSEDNSVTDQALGVGDGTNLVFPLIASFGGFVAPILAPNVITNVKVNGSVISSSNYTVSSWGSANPGVLTFNGGQAPGNGLDVTATFTYYFPVRFDKDTIDFENFMYQLWQLKTLTFTSIK